MATNNARESISFDPDKHLAYESPNAVYNWKDLGFSKDLGVSSFCAAEPFQLFTPEAIQHMRAEVLRPETLNNYCYSDNNTALSMRGFASKHAPFVFSAWKHTRTLEILSKLAGIDLAVNIDYELGHVNFGVKSNKTLTAVQAPGEFLDSASTVDKSEVVGWHKDSYPFSATLMLSDSTETTGGELVIQLENGRQHKLGKSHTGSVVLIQGRHLLHTGLRACGPNVRMTMVTPLWPSSSFVQDETFLTYVAAISDTSELYSQYADYRFRILIDRLQAQRQILREQDQTKLDIEALKDFIGEQREFLTHTNREILECGAVDGWGYKPVTEIPESILRAQTTEIQ